MGLCGSKTARKQAAAQPRQSQPQAGNTTTNHRQQHGGRRGSNTLQQGSSLPAHNVRHGRDAYVELETIERGQATELKTMRNKVTGALVSAKWVQRESGAALGKQTEREIINHRKLLHPHIIRLLEVFTTDTHLVIVMEHMDGQLLEKQLKEEGCIEENRARELFRQLVEAVSYAHKQSVYHRALSTSCLVVTSKRGPPMLKVSDFTYSKNALLDSKPNTAVGNFAYIPPELLLAARDDAEAAGKASDVWACGVVLFLMLTCELPFKDPKEPGALTRVMAQAIVKGNWSVPNGLYLSPDVTDLLSKIFVKSPADRITSEGILRHAWLTSQRPQQRAPAPEVPHQSAADIVAIINRARERQRRAAEQQQQQQQYGQLNGH